MFVVAGASGHVGSVVAGQLLQSEEPLTVLLRNSEQADSWASRGARTVIAQLEETAALSEALRGATGFFVLQPPNSTVRPLLSWQQRMASSVASAVDQSGVRHVVLLSSFGAHLAAGTGPIQGLYHLENALSKTGATVTVFRSCYFQENVRNALGAARQARVFPTFAPSADEPFPHIATRDVGHFVANALRSRPTSSEVIDLEGPAYTHRVVAAQLGAALGVDLTVVEVPRQGWVPALLKGGMSHEMAETFAEMYEALDQGLLVPTSSRRLRGTTSIEETIRQLVTAPPPRGDH